MSPTLSELAALTAEGATSSRGDTVLLTDASSEGETIGAALRERRFHVIDVPITLLEGRVAGEHPRVVIVDIDEPGSLSSVLRLRERPGGIDVLIIGIGDAERGGELMRGPVDHTFERPVDLVRLIDVVANVASPRANSGRGTTPPPSYAPRPTMPPMRESERPPPSDLPPAGDAMLEEFGMADDGLGPLPLGAPIPLSPELDAILAAAELKVAELYSRNSSAPQSDEAPGDDGRLLPPEMLSALDESLGPSDDPSEGTGGVDGTGTPTGWPREAGSAHGTSERESHTRDGRDSAGRPERSRPGDGQTSERDELDDGMGAESRRVPASVSFATSPGPPPSAPGQQAAGPFSMAAATARDLEAAGGATSDPSAITPPGPGLPAALRAMPSLENQPSPSVSWERDGRHRDAGPATTSSPSTGWAPPSSAGPFPPLSQAPPTSSFGGLAASAASFAAGAGGHGSMSAHGPMSAEGSTSSQGSTGPHSTGGVPSVAAGSASAHGAHGPATSREPGASLPEVFTAEDATKIVARAISARASGALAMRTDVGTRHIVLHEGDLVTAASTSPDETLAAFLVERGDLGRDLPSRIGARLPASGRLAGAALVANGYLAQDDLWPVLRSHAEWIVARALVSGPGSCQLEDEPAGRLKSEPGVFGGAAGAEIFVEIVRRTIPPAAAVARLGGPTTRLDTGPRATLLAECALTQEEEKIARALPGRSVGEIVEREGEDMVSVVLALCELDVLTPLAAPRRVAADHAPKDDPLDDEAVRARVRARLALVREGDYFSVLGVAREATAYEIKRAYLDLRRTFEPARLLTARTVDLMDDVRLLLEVADEAYDILKDTTRRERYRRAIEVAPPE